jgi:predicted GNAT family acetyltransferase
MEIQHDIRQKKFYTVDKDNNEYSVEYNEIKPDLWEFHCPYISNIVTNLKKRDISEAIIEYALYYMARNDIKIFESGSCFHVKDFLDKKRDLQFLIKYVV